MFIRFFKTNQPASLLALPLFAVLFWLVSWINPQVATEVFSMPLYYLFSLSNRLPVLSEVIAFVLVLFQSFYINHIINKHDLRESRERSNFLAALFGIVLLSVFPAFRTLLPQHFAGIFLLLMLDRIFDSYRKETAYSHCFDAGFFVGIASLFYFPSVLFFILVWTAFVVLRPFNWREWVISFSGFIIPWLMTITYYFWFDTLGDFINYRIGSSFSASYFSFGKPDNAQLIFIFLLLMLFPALANFLRLMSSGKIKTNKFLLLFMWFLLIAVASAFIFPVGSYTHFTLAAIPLSVIYSNWFLSLKKAWISESLFLILLGAFIYAEIMNRVY
ncbi:MAG: hypothetical protein POELPBGB_01254 [Bacteroidia bacterium]|nr:hypothetical protein [Bacteroidia bacterium]